MRAEGQKWLQGVWLPFGEESATTQAQNGTRLELLKKNHRMCSSGEAAGSTWPAHARPLEQVLGLRAREGPCSAEHQGWRSQTSLAPPERVLIRRALSFPCALPPGATMRSQSSCNQACMSPPPLAGWLPFACPLMPLGWQRRGLGGREQFQVPSN